MGSRFDLASMDDLSNRFNHFLKQDAERAELIEVRRLTAPASRVENADSGQAVLRKINEDKGRLDTLTIELEHERESRHRYQLELRDLREQRQRWEQLYNKDPYVAVLVDGDGAIFNKELLLDPRQGASEAALRLTQAVRNYLKDTPLGSEDVPIVVRIFANLTGLAKSLVTYNDIDHEDKMREFAENFTNSRAEFDFVNVGRGKENADSKMRKMFNHFYKNFQCKKIFFAGCHDNGYLHDLREYAGESGRQRIVLLETTPAQSDFTQMGFQMARFETVFRNDFLGSPPVPPASLSAPRIPSGTTAAADNGVATRPPIAPPSTVTKESPDTQPAITNTVPVRTNSPAVAPPERQASPAVGTVVSSGNGGVSIKYPTYASAGGANGHHNVIIATSAKPKEPRVRYYNSNGHRVDPPNNRPPNPNDHRTYNEKCLRIRPKAFCNELYLADGCSKGPNCPQEHELKLTPGERAVHRWKARGSLCTNGPYCENYRCYLSHHCPFGDGCNRGATCKFKTVRWGDLHYAKADLKPE
ncbi:hypothetical protein KXW98_003148 [Aspergillus fumigatus]|nr:hypothetical protein CNMCM8689_006028 [Aspergillus fumigatus]KAH1324933.1 hypothetical protein KXX38_006714 [Aspergillus fumigatus]KAH1644075.1 hypothetical protein KXX16_002179 [Aspergillus fumigatus]KAH1670878.1 hypothetical protein KXX65_007528 [Aspergillus fumigatus]KAH1864713.1 hypothetical protein KXX01_001844 [Aspergillus fumigatus]